MQENYSKDPRDKFSEHLKSIEITAYRISPLIGYSEYHVRLVLKKERDLGERLRSKLNAYLHTNF